MYRLQHSGIGIKTSETILHQHIYTHFCLVSLPPVQHVYGYLILQTFYLACRVIMDFILHLVCIYKLMFGLFGVHYVYLCKCSVGICRSLFAVYCLVPFSFNTDIFSCLLIDYTQSRKMNACVIISNVNSFLLSFIAWFVTVSKNNENIDINFIWTFWNWSFRLKMKSLTWFENQAWITIIIPHFQP